MITNLFADSFYILFFRFYSRRCIRQGRSIPSMFCMQIDASMSYWSSDTIKFSWLQRFYWQGSHHWKKWWKWLKEEIQWKNKIFDSTPCRNLNEFLLYFLCFRSLCVEWFVWTVSGLMVNFKLWSIMFGSFKLEIIVSALNLVTCLKFLKSLEV